MTARFLVTGATGFLGRRACAALRARGWVRATARSLPDAGPWHDAMPADLAGATLPPALLEGIDVVVHLAGTAHRHDLALADDRPYAAVNVEGTRRLCAAARAAGVRRLVFASSVAVFADADERRVEEGETPAPSSAYGRSKLAAETLVRTHGAEPVVLRFPLLYGPGMPGNLARMVEAIAARRFPPIAPVANRRSMLHVDDAVAALVLAAESPRAAGRTYTVTDGRAYSTHDVYAWTRAALGQPPPSVVVPDAVFRAVARVGDAVAVVARRRAPFDRAAYRKLFGSAEYAGDAIVRELGFVPRHTLEATLPAIVAALRSGRDTA
jgi:nucleoside-diphosphate-sugar epimerase